MKLNFWINPTMTKEEIEEYKQIPIYVLGNKKDLEDSRLISYLQGKQFCQNYKFLKLEFFEVSASENRNNEIMNIYHKMIEKICQQRIPKKLPAQNVLESSASKSNPSIILVEKSQETFISKNCNNQC